MPKSYDQERLEQIEGVALNFIVENNVLSMDEKCNVKGFTCGAHGRAIAMLYIIQYLKLLTETVGSRGLKMKLVEEVRVIACPTGVIAGRPFQDGRSGFVTISKGGIGFDILWDLIDFAVEERFEELPSALSILGQSLEVAEEMARRIVR